MVLAEAGNREVDDCRMDGTDGLVADAQTVGGARPEVLTDHVEAGRHPEEQLDALWVLQVYGHAALVQVVPQERRTHLTPVGVGHEGLGPTAAVAGHRVLDLHHLGPEAGQELGGEREGRHLLGGQDPYAVQRPEDLIIRGIIWPVVLSSHREPVCPIR